MLEDDEKDVMKRRKRSVLMRLLSDVAEATYCYSDKIMVYLIVTCTYIINLYSPFEIGTQNTNTERNNT